MKSLPPSSGSPVITMSGAPVGSKTAVPLSPVTTSAPLPVMIESSTTPPNTRLLPLPASMTSLPPVAAVVSVVCAMLTIDEPVKKSICALSPASVSLPSPVRSRSAPNPPMTTLLPSPT
ncbi:hypothetical protein D3C83_51810 [compost metagenome]